MASEWDLEEHAKKLRACLNANPGAMVPSMVATLSADLEDAARQVREWRNEVAYIKGRLEREWQWTCEKRVEAERSACAELAEQRNCAEVAAAIRARGEAADDVPKEAIRG